VARFLATLPENLGFYNLGSIQAYPTGGTGPTAYGPTSYFGSDPRPQQLGDSINNPANLGDFSPIFRTVTISNSHGGLTRQQSSFYKLKLNRGRAIKIVQNFSQNSYTTNTNRNTVISFYKVEDGNHRRELPINNAGYVYTSTGIDYDDNANVNADDYPNTVLPPGEYIFLITNDIRYLETTYSITLQSLNVDWRYVAESIDEVLDLELITEAVNASIDFGSLAN
jgi:hypothetical protein